MGAVVIHVLAEQATVDGAGDAPGYLPGFGILPAESVRALATVGAAQTADGADGGCRSRAIGRRRRWPSSSGGAT